MSERAAVWVMIMLLGILVSLNGLSGIEKIRSIAALEQTVAELRLDVEDLRAQQHRDLRELLGCADDEPAVCFEQRQEPNAHGYPGPVERSMRCCLGPEKGVR